MSKPWTDVETKREVARAVRAGEVTPAAEAKRLRVSRQSIRRWVERFGRTSRRRSGFVAVDLTPTPPTSIPLVEIALVRGRTLRVPLDLTADDLSRLIRILEAAC